jgi:hypothetical protein
MVDAYFVGIAILTIGASVLALESKELIYGAIALAISMLGIAGFFIARFSFCGNVPNYRIRRSSSRTHHIHSNVG